MNLTDTGNGNGFDLGFQNDISLLEMQEILAKAFNIRFEQVRVDLRRDDYDYDFNWSPEYICVWCKARKQNGGEFSWWLDIIVDPEKLDFSDIETAQKICDVSGSKALYTTDTIDPYEWYLLSPNGGKKTAWVDDNCFDDGTIVITRVFEPGEPTNCDDI